MNVKVESKFNLCYSCDKLFVVFVSLLFLVVLVSSPFLSVVNSVSSVVPDVVVGDEDELLNAIRVAPNKGSYIIGLSGDIVLQNSLEINTGKNISLIMFGDSSSGFVCLIGGMDADTIIVKNGKTLTILNGIVVTHADGAIGRGVYIERGGTFNLAGGKISGNTNNGFGGGVYNCGTFKMFNGEISNNTASYDFGGGVYSDDYATFVILGGEITRNTADMGGGVFYVTGNKGVFTRSGGEIFGNTATINSPYNDNFGILSVTPRSNNLIIRAGAILVGVLLLFYRLKGQKRVDGEEPADSAGYSFNCF